MDPFAPVLEMRKKFHVHTCYDTQLNARVRKHMHSTVQHTKLPTVFVFNYNGLLFNTYRGSISGVNRPEREVHPPLSSAEVTNE